MADWLVNLLEELVRGDRRAIARAISLLEAGGAPAAAIMDELDSRPKRMPRVGITGAPGVGKSTLVNALLQRCRARGMTVAALMVDPSSPVSGGALLGDRVRISAVGDDPGVFIRSMASRGAHGGLALAADFALDVFDAARFELALIETVGVGQAELDIARVADTVVVVLSPESGDDIQAMKSGIMEIGDVFVVNKADLPGADATAGQVRDALQLAAPRSEWKPPVVTVSAATGAGMDELEKAALLYFASRRSANVPLLRRQARLRRMAEASLLEALDRRVDWAALARALQDCEMTFSQAVRKAIAGAVRDE